MASNDPSDDWSDLPPFKDTYPGGRDPSGDGEQRPHLIIEQAHDFLIDGLILIPPDFDTLIPACPEGDADFDTARERLVADHDVLQLWDPSLEGIEDDTDDFRRFVNLHPRKWFLPFDGASD